ncbi:uncharacterized protein LOC131858392 [Cryptomeria japonica]|uniref:uncharacterized protein LOC131858392 n=1 Tax=Cryptomeria japonica TaxID=3369 RepID=UPI0027D9F6F0|nr:uncharacterized protein LOC131858392 [Cryptomeria japonica]
MDWPVPTTVTEVKSFMGLVGYYKCFVEGFTRVAHPITSLPRKGTKLEWTKRCERTFQDLKRALTSAPVLVVPNPLADFMGKENVVAEALSRRHHEICSMSMDTYLRGCILQQLPEDEWYLEVESDGQLALEAIRILARQMPSLRGRELDQVRVQWDYYDEAKASWEDATQMRS